MDTSKIGDKGYRAYKYDILTNNITELSKFTDSFMEVVATVVNTDIYFFTDGNLYKYNTLTDEFIQLQNVPFSSPKACTSVFTDIYFFTDKGVYKYNTLTDEFTQLQNVPFSSPKACTSIFTDIYIFTGEEVYKFITDFYIINKTICIETKYYFVKVLLNKYVEIYFSGAKIYDNGALQDYPTYYGDGKQWNLLN